MNTKKATAAKKSPASESVTLTPIDLRRISIVLVGDSPLITHAWSSKAIKMIKDKQEGKAAANKKKQPRNPEKEFYDAMYVIPGGTPEKGPWGVPATAFKNCAVSGCRHLDGAKMTEARGAFHVVGGPGGLVQLNTDPPVMRTDMIRLSGISSTADVRYRPEFNNWWVEVEVDYNHSSYTLEQILNFFTQGGFGVGICEWRPEKKGGGSFGRFHVASEEEAARLRGEIAA